MISIILLEPENSGNLGAIARAMKNFGFEDLVLVDPKCEINQTARNRAKHAQEILDKAKIRTKRVLKNFDCLIGTTGKLGSDYNMTRNFVTPDELGFMIGGIKKESARIGILIGRESSGLVNRELELCDFVVYVPTNKEYPILNISHAVVVILYELRKAEYTAEQLEKHKIALKPEKDQIMKILDKKLKKMDFTTPDKRETQRKLWKKLVGKSFLTKREAFALIGFLKKIK